MRMAGGDKRRSWGENQSRVTFPTGKKQASIPGQANQVQVQEEGGRGRKVEDSIQLRKDVEELRRRKQELREQFGENEKVLAEVENRLAAVGRHGEIARFFKLKRAITNQHYHYGVSHPDTEGWSVMWKG